MDIKQINESVLSIDKGLVEDASQSLNPKIKAALKEFESLQKKYSKLGAEDTEPDAIFHGVIHMAIKKKPIDWNHVDVSVGRRSPKPDDHWDLYSDKPGAKEATAALTKKAKEVYDVIVKNATAQDIEQLKDYAWRHR